MKDKKVEVLEIKKSVEGQMVKRMRWNRRGKALAPLGSPHKSLHLLQRLNHLTMYWDRQQAVLGILCTRVIRQGRIFEE